MCYYKAYIWHFVLYTCHKNVIYIFRVGNCQQNDAIWYLPFRFITDKNVIRPWIIITLCMFLVHLYLAYSLLRSLVAKKEYIILSKNADYIYSSISLKCSFFRRRQMPTASLSRMRTSSSAAQTALCASSAQNRCTTSRRCPVLTF